MYVYSFPNIFVSYIFIIRNICGSDNSLCVMSVMSVMRDMRIASVMGVMC